MTAVLPTKSIEERKTSKFVLWGRTRIYVLFLTLTCITFMLMNTMTFTFTIICMDDIVEDHHMIWNYTGMGSSVMFTTVGVMPGVWAPSSEVNTFMAILSCSFQLSSIICMPVSGLLCESSFGWRSIYYLFGSITLVMFILFWFTYTDDPGAHRNVSQKELSKIKDGKPPTIIKREPVPYRKMIADPTVLISCISYFGGNMGFFVLCLYGPTYLREVLKFDVKETGFLTALPFILAAGTKFSAGQVSDRLTFLSEKRCLQHVHFPLAAIAVGAYFIQFLAPIIVSFICPDNTAEQWTVFFLFISAVCVVCNLGFPIFTRSEAADYTKKSGEVEKSDEKS
ncbi:hypothetical protein CAEBREN_08565 [Caenorhabditis brenneri]|uniref:Major facilitator superfamily (MFS) profile domain-containing protein n=1 Tax=Caenorhabditis brenneri TaxID=135651 RepID=G0MUG7_CAEBE|nr:hypothetical protein CAEBREN_08565 [Caenorhabditis brenneri]